MKLVIAALSGILLLPVTFYGSFEFAANRITAEYDLPRGTRNSVKHALTAASVYSALRAFQVDRDDAQNMVLALGFFNETLETHIKVGRPDSVDEQRKDLYNNWAGIVAAEWRITRVEGESLASIIAGLAQTGALILKADETRDPRSANALAWFGEHQQVISQKVISALDANMPH